MDPSLRLHAVAAEKYRDSWVACDDCDRWREIPATQSLAEVDANVRPGKKRLPQCLELCLQVRFPCQGLPHDAFGIRSKVKITHDGCDSSTLYSLACV